MDNISSLQNENQSTIGINFSTPPIPIPEHEPNNYINDWVVEDMNLRLFWDEGIKGGKCKNSYTR